MKKIGLVGGMGPASTVEYYFGLIKKTRETFGDEEYPKIVIDSVNINAVTECLRLSHRDSCADLMVRSVNDLAKAGAQVAALTANTVHIVFDKMKDRFEIPVVSIVDAVADEILKMKYQKVLILGTAFTMNSKMYDEALMRLGVAAVLPSEDEKAQVNAMINSDLENGIIIPGNKAKMISIIEKYLRSKAIDSVLLGCTELPLLIKPEDISVPIVNSTQIHIDALFRAANE